MHRTHSSLQTHSTSQWTPSSETHVGVTPEVSEQEDPKLETSCNDGLAPPQMSFIRPRSDSGLAVDNRVPLSAYGDPRVSAYTQQWGIRAGVGFPPEFVSAQPQAMDAMSVGAYTMETFPYDRAPNLQKLTKVYYRLYTRNGGAYPSKHPEHADDPSLSHIYAEHVSPPRHARHYLLHVCSREGIHTSRMQLYLKNPASSDLRLALDEEHLQVPVADNELETTLYFNIEMPNEAGGQVAAQSLSCCTLGMRAIGRCTGGCCSGSASALSGVCNSICGIPESIARSMHYCCLNFRIAWITCWTCGNPAHYENTSDRSCHCLLCPCFWCCDC